MSHKKKKKKKDSCYWYDADWELEDDNADVTAGSDSFLNPAIPEDEFEGNATEEGGFVKLEPGDEFEGNEKTAKPCSCFMDTPEHGALANDENAHLSFLGYDVENPISIADDFTEEDKEAAFELLKKENSKVIKHDDGFTSPYNMAQRLLEKHHFIFLDPPWKNKTLSFYNGSYWNMLPKERFDAIVYQELSSKERHAIPNISGFTTNVFEFVCRECILGYIQKKDRYYFSNDKFEKVKFSTVFRNGIYNAKKGKFYPNGDKNPELYPYTHALDADYVENGETRYMDKLLFDASHDQATLEYAYELLGYICIPARTAKAFIVLAGVGNSGKSVFGGFCESVFVEDRAFRVQPDLLCKQFAYSQADTAYLYSCLDMETKIGLSTKEVSQLKIISGEDSIRSEAKYQNQKTVPIRFKLLLATNGSVRSADVDDDAFYYRLRVLPFLYKTAPEKMIADLPTKLQREKSAILSHAVRSISKCINDSGHITFHVSEISTEMIRAWRDEGDSDKAFFFEAFTVTGASNDIVNKSELYEAYKFYASIHPDKIRMINSQSALVNKIQSYDPERIKAKNVKSRKTLNGDLTNPAAAIAGIRWNEQFLEEIEASAEEQ